MTDSMLMTTPAGALVDATKRNNLYVIIPGICTVLASDLVLLSQQLWLVSASRVATATAGAAFGPAASTALWIGFASVLKPACALTPDDIGKDKGQTPAQ